MEFDDVRTRHEVDQALAEAISMGDVSVTGKAPDGDNLMSLTAKGIVRTALLFVQKYIGQADGAHRDFTPEEKQELAEHLTTALQALEK